MLIQHPDRVGKTLAALSLISDHIYRITINGTKIKVSLGPSSVKEFQTEEEFMVWVLNRMKDAVDQELSWFEDKYGIGGESA